MGEYVLVHVGFAISIVDEEEAARMFEYLKEMDDWASWASSRPRRAKP